MTSRREFLYSTVGIAGSLAAAPRVETRPSIQPPEAWFLARLPQMMQVSGTPGFAAVIVQRRRIVWEHYAGVQKAGTSPQVNANTLWPAASLGKPVFAATTLGLVREGVLDLDRPLREYVADHAADDERTRKVTIRHALSHTGGFPNWRSQPGQALASRVEPGSAFSYSGEGYFYVQRAVEQVTGMGIQQCVSRRLFDPLAMTSSTYTWRADAPERLVAGHDRGVATAFGRELRPQLWAYAQAHGRSLDTFGYDDIRRAMEELPDAPPPLPNQMAPNVAGGLLTTARDYAAFLSALLDPDGTALGLTRALRNEMARPQIALNALMGWGLGWGLETNRGTLWHWGDNGGWKNFALVEPRDDAALVVFTNSSHGMNVAERLVAASTGTDHVAFQWL